MSLYTFSLNTNHSHLIVTTPTDVYALPYLGLSFGTPQGPSGDEQVTFFSNGLAMVSVRIMQSNLAGATWQLRIADLIANYLYMPVGSSAGSVTSVDVSGGSSGLVYTGGPITTSGVITLTSGQLAIGYGGTNSTTALNNNRIMVSAAGAIVEAAALADGQVLLGSTGAAPVAASLTAGSGITITPGAGSLTIAAPGATGGTVTSVDVSGGTTGLTTTGGPVTTSGTITLAGTLGVANGGTGATSLSGDRVVLTNAGGTALTTASAMTDGQLIIGATGGAPAAASLTAGSGITITPGANSLTIATSGGGGVRSLFLLACSSEHVRSLLTTTGALLCCRGRAGWFDLIRRQCHAK